ncbi:hypothetical protein HW450_12105 [Corynebacterium hindlerae]|uniref:Uncharacterized protein n=1 Tax=Corynebacterium hindlerae TaxID=699041 RepID=A0A7G5FEL6_9CORY|nr:hypothetical protein [Corynebacterium hindlerae]QMV85057.1 hypothetical protein HW450_12105 [Corynebacterium hindlerae]
MSLKPTLWVTLLLDHMEHGGVDEDPTVRASLSTRITQPQQGFTVLYKRRHDYSLFFVA